MRKIGKRTKMNQKARKMIAKFCEEWAIVGCEVQLAGCMREAHGPAHRKKKRHYKTAEELADSQEWVASCQSCHGMLEADPELTKIVFKGLR